jgi:broad specificity phosphatase PhoE
MTTVPRAYPGTRPPIRLVLIRHGESAWNAERRLQGQSDAPLSEKGREQGVRLRDVLASLPIDGAVTSDLVRARETAELAGFGEARGDQRWREFDLGPWGGRLEDDVPAEELAAFRRAALVPPGGESWPLFAARVASAVEALGRETGTWAVFTHGGAVRAAVAHVTGARPETVAGPVNTSLTLVELAPRRRLLTFNWSPEPGLPRASDPGGD